MTSKRQLMRQLLQSKQILRQDLKLRLYRLIEGFEYAGKNKSPVDIQELVTVLRVALFNCQAILPPSVSLTKEEIQAVLRLHIWLQRYSSNSIIYLEAMSLCECVLKHCSHHLSVEMFSDVVLQTLPLLTLTQFPSEPDAHSGEEEETFQWILSPIQTALHNSTALSSQTKADIGLCLTQLASLWPTLGARMCPIWLPILIQWLQSTDVYQTYVAQSLGDQVTDPKNTKTIQELDNTPFQDRFTVLNVGKYLTQSQLLHIELFGCVKTWLGLLSPGLSGNFHSYLMDLASYLLRLLDQCENQWKSPVCRDLLQCCLLEVIDCALWLSRHYPTAMERIYSKCESTIKLRDLPPVILLKFNLFFHQNASIMGKQPDGYLQVIFKDLLTQHYQDSDFVHELLAFLVKKCDTLSPMLTKYFPNLCKAFLWNPCLYALDLHRLFPAFVTDSNILELFHYILDMPSIAACMEWKRDPATSTSMESNDTGVNVRSRYVDFLLRCESGSCDTVANLQRFHDVLQPYSQGARVLHSCDIALALLPFFFDLVLLRHGGRQRRYATLSQQQEDDTCRDLLSIMLERAHILFGPMTYKKHVLGLFANMWLRIVQHQPVLVLHCFEELVEFWDTLSQHNVLLYYRFVLAVVRTIGLSASSLKDAQRTEWISHFLKLYDAVEYRAFEWLRDATLTRPDSTDVLALWSVIASVLFRVSIVYSDRQSRCALLFNKIHRHFSNALTVKNDNQASVEILLSRLSELMVLLKFKDIDSVMRLETLDPVEDSSEDGSGGGGGTVQKGMPSAAHTNPASSVLTIKEIDYLLHYH